MTIALRPYAVQDRANLIGVIDEVCSEGRYMSTTRFEPTPSWELALQATPRNDHLLLLAADGPTVVGWCRVFPEAGAQRTEASLGVGLLRPYRNRGIGGSLVQQALWWAWSAGLQRVTLKTRLDNGRALRVFVRCGFEFLSASDGVWADMACSRPALWLSQDRSPTTQHTLYSTPTISGTGSERVWL